MSNINHCIDMQTEYILKVIQQKYEINCVKAQLEKVKSEVRKCKIDILKNGSRKDKLNLLIEERLQDLENEEKEYEDKINEID